MRYRILFLATVILLLSSAILVASQEIPDDPNHLPRQIGGRKSGSNKVDSISVTGKVILEGIPVSGQRPVIYIIAYNYGRFVDKRQVSENGSYILNEVPREGSAIAVEIEGNEVESRQIIPSPANTVYQDFTVNLTQVKIKEAKAKVVSAKNLYERSDENQKLFVQAKAAIDDKKNSKATTLFKRIIDSDPRDFVSIVQLGNVYFLDDTYSEAEKLYHQALGLKPDYTLALINLGKLLLIQKDTDNAVNVFTKAVESEPESADANQMLGEAYLMAKKGSKAVVYLNKAIELEPVGKAEVHLRLAALYDAAGLKERAAAEYRSFLQKVPGYGDKAKLDSYIKEYGRTQ